MPPAKSPDNASLEKCNPKKQTAAAVYDDRLIDCVKKNDVKALTAIIGEGADVNARGGDGLTPLQLATVRNFAEIARVLIDKGADVNAVDDRGETLLRTAIREKSKEIAVLLIEKGADVNATDGTEYSVLHLAILANLNDIARELIKKGAKLNAKGEHLGDAPLHCAVDARSAEAVRLLIERGADVNVKNRYGSTPLHKAAGRTKKLLPLDKDGEVKALEGGEGRSESKEIARLLIEKDAYVNAKDNEGNTALHKAAESDSKDTAKLLIDKGAKIDARNDAGETPLHRAAIRDSFETARLLIEKGADVNARDNKLCATPLHNAAQKNSEKIALLLIARGADINAKWGEGVTPLHCAAVADSRKCVKLLIAKGADANAMGKDGLTPSFYARQYSRENAAGVDNENNGDAAGAAGNDVTDDAARIIKSAGGSYMNPKATDVNPEYVEAADRLQSLSGALTDLRRKLKKEYGILLSPSQKTCANEDFDADIRLASELSTAAEEFKNAAGLLREPASPTAVKYRETLYEYVGSIATAAGIQSKKAAFLLNVFKNGNAENSKEEYDRVTRDEQAALDGCWTAGKKLKCIISNAKTLLEKIAEKN